MKDTEFILNNFSVFSPLNSGRKEHQYALWVCLKNRVNSDTIRVIRVNELLWRRIMCKRII